MERESAAGGEAEAERRHQAQPQRPARPRWLAWAAAGVVVVLALAFPVAHFVWDFSPMAWMARFEALIRGWGPFGVAAAIGLMIAHSFVPLPAEFIALAIGMVYGPLWGIVITWAGAMLGAFVAFALARALGRPFVERMVARRHWARLDRQVAAEGWRVLLVSRLVPVIAFNLINYAAGLTAVSWRTFAWTTGLGILPMTVLMVVMGDSLDDLTWLLWALPPALLALWWAVRRLGRGG